MNQSAYTTLVDGLAGDIAAGRLKPGDRLPPQRIFAYERGIAASTAARVYAELLRRGLVVGEVGRGTFVAGRQEQVAPGFAELEDGRVDLEFNFPSVPEQAELVANALAGLLRPDALSAAAGPLSRRRLDAACEAAAGHLASPRWQPQADGFVFTGSGRQSIATAISTLVPVGGRLAVEALSYPMVKTIAARLGVAIVPIAMDDEGPCPDAIARAHRAGALSAVYVQPVLHNPLGHTMGADRRAEIVALAERLDLHLIEDLVYGFLSDSPPLAALAPERSIVASSLSKCIAPGLAVGLLHMPRAMRDRVAAIGRAGAWTAAPLALDAAARLMADGTAAELMRLKRADARVRQAIVAETLGEHDLQADPGSYHAWMRLPEGWRSELFVVAAGREGISITPSSAFAMTPGHAPNAVRLALGHPSHDELRSALERLAALLAGQPEDTQLTE
jgi:DNA-binding transcriptional MocR family regulator